MKDAVAPPQQQRSRETLARLLRATIETLERYGLQGTTIPRVAAAAGVAPANVYRRFRDKDALFRAAFLQVLEEGAASNRSTLRTGSLACGTLEELAAKLVGGIVRQYRAHPALLRAFIRFVETDTDASFKKTALGYIANNIRDLGEVLLTFRDRISHPNPERAVLFGLLNVATVIEMTTLDEISVWQELLPMQPDEMQTELTRVLVTYLRG